MPTTVDTEVGEGHYMMLSDADLLMTYRDVLRGKETDHARRVATPGDYVSNVPAYEQRLEALESDIVGLREKVVEYEAKVEEEAARAQAELEAQERAAVESTEE